MDCKQTEQQLIAYTEHTLSKKEEQKIAIHLEKCVNCKKIFLAQEQLENAFKTVEDNYPSEKLKTDFYAMLNEEKALQTKETTIVTSNKFSYKTAFQIAASIVVIFTGYFIGSTRLNQESQQQIASLQLETLQMKKNVMLAMIENRSPSKRIQAVSFTSEIQKPDKAVLTALIDRLQYDSNSNVRLAAAEALAKFSTSETVKKALIQALENEKNPSLQIELINILVTIQEKRALAPIKKIINAPETPVYVKELANAGISKLI